MENGKKKKEGDVEHSTILRRNARKNGGKNLRNG